MKNLKRYLPPIMRTTFWSSLMDTVEEAISDLREQKIDDIKNVYSISDSSRDILIELAHTVYGLDSYMLQNLMDFLVGVELNKLESSSLTESEKYSQAHSVALERFRQEILKIPYSMARRGTLNFYISTLEFFDFNYSGILSSTRTDTDKRVSRIIVNLSLEPCKNVENSVYTPKVLDSVSNLEGRGFYYLDQSIQGKKGQLDPKDVRIYLDLEKNIETRTYRKTMFLGLILDSRTSRYYSSPSKEITEDYEGGPTFPESLGRFYQSFLSLNKRATDVLLFGPMLSLNLVQQEEPIQIFADQRMNISWNSKASFPSSITSTGLKFKYYSENLQSTPKPFYEQTIYDYSADKESKTLVVFGMMQGESLKHYKEVTEIQQSGKKCLQVTIPKEDWKEEFILRLYSTRDENSQYLFYRDKWNNLIQRVNDSKFPDLRAEVNTSKPTEVTITFKSVDGEDVGENLNICTYKSQLLHSSVKAVQLLYLEQEILRIQFERNTQIEVCKGIVFSTYLCCHFKK